PPPAAEVDARRKQQRDDDPGLRRPRLSEATKWSVGVLEYWSIGFKMHYSIPPSLQYPSRYLAESRAAGTFAGRNVCMKATRAVTSSGARFLPTAGMLPPPRI